MKHILVATVENKPGVLNRVSSLFRRRNFNIDSLTVGETESHEVSRMTIVVDASRTSATLVRENLYKLVNVIDVQDVTNSPAVVRDLLLIRVTCDASRRAEVMQVADIFRGKIVDVAPDSVIVELTGEEDKINSFIDLMRPFGIEEMVRTGLVAMARGTTNVNGHRNGDSARLGEKYSV
ncbi:MAG: acetolactate synthase small subunit [Ardenticatenaceae bacterium]|nr:acetolactate synthase small subunit [Ardenticatenaceae bacterium]HBY97875.1 acetolactate synthase small subunit [Chloroflexota bacterium]